jgi:hypothetical protein
MTSKLSIGAQSIEQLRAFRTEPKFQSDAKLFYPGAPNEVVRLRCEARLTALLDRLLMGIENTPTKEYVLGEVRTVLPQYEAEDSEERDRLLVYLERIMDITGIESSDGLLNEWRYGFNASGA